MSMPASDTAEPIVVSTSTESAGYRALIAGCATLAGCLAASAALGVALPRISQTAGAALLAGLGLVFAILLLAAACGLIVRTTRRWGRLVLLPWLVVVLVAVYAMAIALAAAYPPRPPSGDMPPDATPVTMTASDGVALAGWYLPTLNGAVVVLRHGAGSRAADAIAQARALNEAGYGVLATDARGHGASGGRGIDLGWYGEVDIRAAVDLLAGRTDLDADRIAVVGLSMGGEEAIGAAGVDGRICAVVAEGATGRTAADKSWLAEEYGATGVVQGWLDTVSYGLVDLLVRTGPPPSLAESLEASQGTRFLLIAAGEVRDEQLVAERLQQIDPDRVSVWTVAGAEHSRAMQSSPQEWSSEVVGFLETAFADCERRAGS